MAIQASATHASATQAFATLASATQALTAEVSCCSGLSAAVMFAAANVQSEMPACRESSPPGQEACYSAVLLAPHQPSVTPSLAWRHQALGEAGPEMLRCHSLMFAAGTPSSTACNAKSTWAQQCNEYMGPHPYLTAHIWSSKEPEAAGWMATLPLPLNCVLMEAIPAIASPASALAPYNPAPSEYKKVMLQAGLQGHYLSWIAGLLTGWATYL